MRRITIKQCLVMLLFTQVSDLDFEVEFIA